MAVKLNFRFHDPNPSAVTVDAILDVFFEVNKPKVEVALREQVKEDSVRESE